MLLMKDIINDQNKLIRTISKEVSLPLSKEDHDLLMEMHEFLVASQDEELSEKYNLRPAVGIAAIQLGIPKRMCAIHVLDYDENGEPTKSTDYALVNPKIVSYTQKQSYLKMVKLVYQQTKMLKVMYLVMLKSQLKVMML